MAFEILRPISNGDTNSFGFQYPNTGVHYDKVDDVISDDATTYIYSTTNSSSSVDLRICLKLNGTIYDSDNKSVVILSWGDYSNTWTLKPSNNQVFFKDDIDNLQIGVYETITGERDLFNVADYSQLSSADYITVCVRAIRVLSLRKYSIRVSQVYLKVYYTSDVDFRRPAPKQTVGGLSYSGRLNG